MNGYKNRITIKLILYVLVYKKLLNLPDTEQYVNCQKWSDRYDKAHDGWKDLSQKENENDKWKKEILQIIKKDK